MGKSWRHLARTVSFTLITSLLFSGLAVISSHATMPSSGLLVDLRANKSASYSGSGTSWFDLSGNSRTATLQGSPTWNSSLGGIFTLDGTDHFTLNSGFANFTSGLSISVYANFGSNSSTRIWERLMDFGNAAESENILFARYSDSKDLTLEIFKGNASQGYCRATNAILDNADINNNWATYAATLDGSTCKLYRD
jgi:hypothetical protein